jgi:hypothetical protein
LGGGGTTKCWFEKRPKTNGSPPWWMTRFLRTQNALVDVWSYGEGGLGPARRIPATELWELKQQPREQPTFITVTYREQAAGAFASGWWSAGLRPGEMPAAMDARDR